MRNIGRNVRDILRSLGTVETGSGVWIREVFVRLLKGRLRFVEEAIDLIVELPGPFEESDVPPFRIVDLPIGAEGMSVDKITEMDLAFFAAEIVAQSVRIRHEGDFQFVGDRRLGSRVECEPDSRTDLDGIDEGGRIEGRHLSNSKRSV